MPKKLMTSITSIKSNAGSSIDVRLTHQLKWFHHTGTFETGLSDCHRLVRFFLKAYCNKLPQKTIEYSNYKKFNKKKLYKLDQELVKEIRNQSVTATFLKISFEWIFDNYAPLK